MDQWPSHKIFWIFSLDVNNLVKTNFSLVQISCRTKHTTWHNWREYNECMSSQTTIQINKIDRFWRRWKRQRIYKKTNSVSFLFNLAIMIHETKMYCVPEQWSSFEHKKWFMWSKKSNHLKTLNKFQIPTNADRLKYW